MLNGHSDKIEDMYPAFDLHVLPSVSEAFGLVTLEAMSCGVPAMMADVGCAKSICLTEDFIFDSYNSNELSEKIYSFYKSKKSGKLKGLTNRVRNKAVKNFSFDELIFKYRRVWLEG